MKTVKSVVDQEIKNSGIDIAGLRKILYSPEKLEELISIYEVVSKNPVTKFRNHFHDLTREQQLENNIKRISHIYELGAEGKVPRVDTRNYGSFTLAINCLYPLSVHHGMFEFIVQKLCSDEQIEKYWDDIRSLRIIGCYAQTEIGTGSNVRGLETEAVYDKETEEFVIHSPTIKSIKAWPGDLGKMANFAVVFARLIIDEDDYGVQGFLMQIKDLDTHEPLPGIEVGDLGPKYGYNIKDNGYMKFDRVRIPRSAILSRYVSVSKDGMLEIKGDPRIAYAAMVWIRVTLLDYNWQALIANSSAVSRYLLMRRQFKNIANSNEERQIIDYQATQTKLISVVAFAFANLFASKYCRELHDKMHQEIRENDDFSLMNDLHILASSLKGYYMQECIDSLFILRELCGGHGYSYYTNITSWIEHWSPNVTLEGDSNVLYQQTTRKLVNLVLKGKGANKTVYPYIDEVFNSGECKETDEKITDLNQLMNVLKFALIFQLEHLINNLKADDGNTKEAKWINVYLIDITKVAKLHAIYMSALSFKRVFEQTKSLDKKTIDVVEMLLKVYICDSILKFGEFALIREYVNSNQMDSIDEYYQQLVSDLRPHIISILESSNFVEDQFRNEIINDSTEDYCAPLFELAKASPINRKTKLESIDQWVKPLSSKLQNFSKL